MPKVVRLPVQVAQDADAHARANTERTRRLFAWADATLKRLGLDQTVLRAKSIEELDRMRLDVETAEITLAIRDALHPASGKREEHFRNLKEGGLKQILKNRFDELKKTRKATLR